MIQRTPRWSQIFGLCCFCLTRTGVVVVVAAYVTRDDAEWPTRIVWQHELETALSNGASMRYLPNNTSALAATYRDECEIALGDDPYALANNGLCLQAHFCARSFCQPTENFVDSFNLPAAIINVRTVSDISQTLAFARRYNIPVSIKTSGHSYQGSSTSRDSILIWMFHYPKDDTITKDYPNSCGATFDTVLHVGGGELFDDILEAFKGDYHAVTGSCRTVSAAGGWLQGVGLSWTSRRYGVGVDNVIDFDVVLPNGTFVEKVDACREPDLFWALRGGGGGTFGVVTKARVQLHPPTPIVRLSYGPQRGDNLDSDAFRRFRALWLDYWVTKAPTLDNRWGGTWSDRGCKLYFAGSKWDAFWTFGWDATLWYMFTLREIPFISGLFDGYSTTPPVFTLKEYNNWYEFRGGADAVKNPDRTTRTGYTDWFYGARLIPQDIVEQNPKEVAAFLESVATVEAPIEGYYLGGVMQNVGPDETAVHPAMRKAIWSIEPNSPEAAIQIREFFPNSVTGASFNHHSREEPDWRNALWGDNYERLAELKQRYDPDNVLNCWHCVGYIGEEYETPS